MEGARCPKDDPRISVGSAIFLISHTQAGVFIQQVLTLNLPPFPPKSPLIFQLKERSGIKDTCLSLSTGGHASLPPRRLQAGLLALSASKQPVHPLPTCPEEVTKLQQAEEDSKDFSLLQSLLLISRSGGGGGYLPGHSKGRHTFPHPHPHPH